MTQQLKNYLTRLQRTHNLSISALARTTGVSRRTVVRLLERDIDVVRGGPVTPTTSTLEKIAEAFGVGISDVLKRLPKFAIDKVRPQY